MQEIGLFEAKNRLSALVEQVAATGEEIIITKRSKPMVKITPCEVMQKNRKAALDALMRFGERTKLNLVPGETIKSLIEEGRKY